MTDVEILKIKHSEEYGEYLSALCRLASGYVSRIRLQFAEKAFEKYKDETTRRLVLAYGKEAAELDAKRLRDFSLVSDYTEMQSCPYNLDDPCLNNAEHYGAAIKMLFDIA